MKAVAGLLQTLLLKGLVPAAPQQCGSVRLVPLLRPQVRAICGWRCSAIASPLSVVALDGPPDGMQPGGAILEGLKYIGYIPHGLVVL